MMKRLAILMGVGLSLLAHSPRLEAQATRPPAAETLVHASAPPLTLAAGTSGVLTVTLRILPGWHINANPPALEYNIATVVALQPQAGVRPGKVVYPAGKSRKLSFEDQPLLVYDESAEVRVPVTIAATATNGTHTLRGTVEYQGCNDQVCLTPTVVQFTVDVTVTGGAAAGGLLASPDSAAATDSTRAPPADSAVGTTPSGSDFQTGPPPGSSGAVQQRLESALTQGGFVWFALLFLLGLSLNLTPCVFPMLGVTVSIFGARRKEPLPKVLLHAVAYVLGIAVMYSALGVVAALTGGLFGAALQNPLVNVALGILLVGLSLSMFGLYELQLPGWVMDRLGGANTTSVLGIFFSGLGVGVIAAPCVGPVVVGVLAVVAQKASVPFGFQTMFALSIGLGFPYLFLAAFSNLIQSLPRSGGWMVWVKKLFGVLLATIGLNYVAIALVPSVAPWVVPAALLLGGMYLGFMEKSANDRTGFRLFKRFGGSLALVAAVMLVLQITAAHSRGIVFLPYSEQAVEASLAKGRPVLLDFSANWCAPCHELEQQTFPDRRVQALAAGFDAYVIDLTQFKSVGSERSRQKYGVTGVPTVIFLVPGKGEVAAARVEGFVPPAVFVERLRLAGAR